MSKPILYSDNSEYFDNNGIGILNDAISCEVTEERNGAFELNMTYPITGIHYEEIKCRCVIKAKPDQIREPQLFRIVNISRPMNGIVSISANHISYDLSGMPTSTFSSIGANSSLRLLKENSVIDCPFEFYSDIESRSKFTVSTPSSIRSMLGGVEGSILDIFGGEFEFDNYNVNLYKNRGYDRGVSIRYGKNLTDIVQEDNCSSVYTGVYPYWKNQDGELVEIDEKFINADGTFDFEKIKTVDFTQYFDNKPTKEQLRNETIKYMEAKKIGVPTVSLKVSFAQLEQSEEYKNIALLERVYLCDYVSVYFPALNVSANSKVIKIVYDVINDRVKSVELGDAKSNIAETISNQIAEIEKKPSISYMQSAILNLTSNILGAIGGSVRLLDTDEDGMPDTLYVADNSDPNLAIKVWRWNYEGWAASKNGYNGPFVMGATLDDGILAESITAANLVSGSIKSADDGKTFYLDLNDGVLKMDATELFIGGNTINDFIADGLTQEEIFNILTNGGETQGLYLKDGKLYINASYIQSGKIESDNIGLYGKLKVYQGTSAGGTYTGSTIGYVSGAYDGIVTDGTAIFNESANSMVIVTNAGVRMNYKKNQIYVTETNAAIKVGGTTLQVSDEGVKINGKLITV